MMASLRWRHKLMTKATKCTKDVSRHACFISPYVQYVFNHIQQKNHKNNYIVLHYTTLQTRYMIEVVPNMQIFCSSLSSESDCAALLGWHRCL